MPLYRRIPQKGFSNHPFKLEYAIVNIGDLQRHFSSGETVDAEALRRARLVKGKHRPVKLLGRGKIDKEFTVSVDAVSRGAREAIEKAGGSVEAPSSVSMEANGTERVAETTDTTSGDTTAGDSESETPVATNPEEAEEDGE
jgi:large subunit ribosomal protein L15